MTPKEELAKLLEHWINKNGYDTRLNKPDYLLAEALSYDIVHMFDTLSKEMWGIKLFEAAEIDDFLEVEKVINKK